MNHVTAQEQLVVRATEKTFKILPDNESLTHLLLGVEDTL